MYADMICVMRCVAADSAKSAPNGESDITIMCESADVMNSWLKTISHMQVSTWSLAQAITGLRNADKEVVIKFMPAICRLLLALMCVRDDIKSVDAGTDVKAAVRSTHHLSLISLSPPFADRTCFCGMCRRWRHC
jgi:hypothetical protein